ncbi:MAG: hypothetical protein Q9179_002878 [Wetmoreana sp. 5 TL-2023]
MPQPSEYDSDRPIPPAEILSTPPFQRTNTELNLSVLQRHLPSTTHIVSIAPYAVVYTFTPTAQNWEKSGIEGTLFVCQQSPSRNVERFSVVVLNRKGLNDFVCPLSEDVDFESGYIILRSTDADGGDNIWGLWIFEEQDGTSTAGLREVNAKIIQDCALRAARPALDLNNGGGQSDGYGDKQNISIQSTTKNYNRRVRRSPRSLDENN